MLNNAQSAELEPLSEACRPKGKTLHCCPRSRSGKHAQAEWVLAATFRKPLLR